MKFLVQVWRGIIKAMCEDNEEYFWYAEDGSVDITAVNDERSVKGEYEVDLLDYEGDDAGVGADGKNGLCGEREGPGEGGSLPIKLGRGAPDNALWAEGEDGENSRVVGSSEDAQAMT